MGIIFFFYKPVFKVSITLLKWFSCMYIKKKNYEVLVKINEELFFQLLVHANVLFQIVGCKGKNIEKRCPRGRGHIQLWVKVLALVWRSSMYQNTWHHFREVYKGVNVRSYENVFNVDNQKSNRYLFTCRLVLGSLAIRWPPRSNSLTCLLS